jgi:hypothetical protein
MTWYTPAMTGTLPEARAQHSAIVVTGAPFMVVFGGQTERKICQLDLLKLNPSLHDGPTQKLPFETALANNDVFILNLQTYHWHIPKIDGTKPEQRYGHAMQIHPVNPMCLFLFGGRSAAGYQDMRLHCLDLGRFGKQQLTVIHFLRNLVC